MGFYRKKKKLTIYDFWFLIPGIILIGLVSLSGIKSGINYINTNVMNNTNFSWVETEEKRLYEWEDHLNKINKNIDKKLEQGKTNTVINVTDFEHLIPNKNNPDQTQWDWTSSFQSALNSLNDGDTLLIPSNNYKITKKLSCNKTNITIKGAGSKTILLYDYEQQLEDQLRENSLLVFEEGVQNITLKNFTVKYLGTFDTGGTYTGLISGIIFKGYCENILIDGVEATGFNREGIAFVTDSPINFARNVKITNCNLHHNRVAGLWFQNSENVSVLNNDCSYNGLQSDDQTGYGISFQGTNDGTPNYSKVINNKCFYNARKGIDYHAGMNAIVENNICHGNKIVGIFAYGNRCENISVKNNIISGMNTNQASRSIVCAIHIGKSSGKPIVDNPFYLIEGNNIYDINQTTTEGNLIRIGMNLKQGLVSIKNNIINANSISSICQIRELPQNYSNILVDISNNDFNIDVCDSNNPFIVAGSFINFSNNKIKMDASIPKTLPGFIGNIVNWPSNLKQIKCMNNFINSQNVIFENVVTIPKQEKWEEKAYLYNNYINSKKIN